jgi:hypothetical protein
MLIGYLGDDDADRKTQADALLNTYSRDLERRRLAAGAAGLLIVSQGKSYLNNPNELLILGLKMKVLLVKKMTTRMTSFITLGLKAISLQEHLRSIRQ